MQSLLRQAGLNTITALYIILHSQLAIGAGNQTAFMPFQILSDKHSITQEFDKVENYVEIKLTEMLPANAMTPEQRNWLQNALALVIKKEQFALLTLELSSEDPHFIPKTFILRQIEYVDKSNYDFSTLLYKPGLGHSLTNGGIYLGNKPVVATLKLRRWEGENVASLKTAVAKIADDGTLQDIASKFAYLDEIALVFGVLDHLFPPNENNNIGELTINHDLVKSGKARIVLQAQKNQGSTVSVATLNFKVVPPPMVKGGKMRLEDVESMIAGHFGTEIDNWRNSISDVAAEIIEHDKKSKAGTMALIKQFGNLVGRMPLGPTDRTRYLAKAIHQWVGAKADKNCSAPGCINMRDFRSLHLAGSRQLDGTELDFYQPKRDCRKNGYACQIGDFLDWLKTNREKAALMLDNNTLIVTSEDANGNIKDASLNGQTLISDFMVLNGAYFAMNVDDWNKPLFQICPSKGFRNNLRLKIKWPDGQHEANDGWERINNRTITIETRVDSQKGILVTGMQISPNSTCTLMAATMDKEVAIKTSGEKLEQVATN